MIVWSTNLLTACLYCLFLSCAVLHPPTSFLLKVITEKGQGVKSFLFLKVTNSCRIPSATYMAECPCAVLEQCALSLLWKFSAFVRPLKKLMIAVAYYSEVHHLPVMEMSQVFEGGLLESDF